MLKKIKEKLKNFKAKHPRICKAIKIFGFAFVVAMAFVHGQYWQIAIDNAWHAKNTSRMFVNLIFNPKAIVNGIPMVFHYLVAVVRGLFI